MPLIFRILNEFYAKFKEAVTKNLGQLIKFIGDAINIAFTLGKRQFRYSLK